MQMQAEQLLRDGRLAEALASLKEQARTNPADAKLRMFLFQLLSVMGQWDKALTQLNVAADLDAKNLLTAQLCRAALNCEALRAEIFAGKRTPLIFGEPQEWVGLLLQANQLFAAGQAGPAGELRDRAFEAAPPTPGTVNDDQTFEWIADADNRLGPMLEAIIGGRYYWLPFQNLREVIFEEPADLRDAVWMPAQLVFVNGGNSFGLIPTRYPGSETSADPDILLSRKTNWAEDAGGFCRGLGQRLLATDAGEYALMDLRHITLGPADAAPETPAGEAEHG